MLLREVRTTRRVGVHEAKEAQIGEKRKGNAGQGKDGIKALEAKTTHRN